MSNPLLGLPSRSQAEARQGPPTALLFFSLEKAAVIPKLVLKVPKISGGLTFSPHWEPKLGPNISEGCGRASNKVDELANKREGKSGKGLKSKKQKTTKQTSSEQ